MPSIDKYEYTCPNCGDYKISGTIRAIMPTALDKFDEKKHLISGYIREMTELGLTTETITEYNYDGLLVSSLIPKNPLEKLNKLVLFFHRKSGYLFQEIEIAFSQPAIAYAKNEEEFANMIEALRSLDYIDSKSDAMGNSTYYLTLKGIEKAEELQKEVKNSKQAFVAMWFDSFMNSIFTNFITQAIKDAGYDPFIISLKEHNDDICDEIRGKAFRKVLRICTHPWGCRPDCRSDLLCAHKE